MLRTWPHTFPDAVGASVAGVVSSTTGDRVRWTASWGWSSARWRA